MKNIVYGLLAMTSLLSLGHTESHASPLADNQKQIEQGADAVEQKVIDWRRHLHQNPELSNREFETSKYIERHLRSLGLEV